MVLRYHRRFSVLRQHHVNKSRVPPNRARPWSTAERVEYAAQPAVVLHGWGRRQRRYQRAAELGRNSLFFNSGHSTACIYGLIRMSRDRSARGAEAPCAAYQEDWQQPCQQAQGAIGARLLRHNLGSGRALERRSRQYLRQ